MIQGKLGASYSLSKIDCDENVPAVIAVILLYDRSLKYIYWLLYHYTTIADSIWSRVKFRNICCGNEVMKLSDKDLKRQQFVKVRCYYMYCSDVDEAKANGSTFVIELYVTTKSSS